jgi:hypothetical protein
MNIYTPIAEYELAKAQIVRARAALDTESSVPFVYCNGVGDALDLLNAKEALLESDLKTLREAVQMPHDLLFHAILWNYGHDVYLHEESPLAQALIQMCALQHDDWGYNACAQAIADQYDRKRLGEDL